MPKNINDLRKNAGIKWGKIRTPKHTNILTVFRVDIFENILILYHCYNIWYAKRK